MSGHSLKEIKPLIRKVLKIFQRKNMKIKLSKFEISQRVTFGGCQIQAIPRDESVEIAPEANKVKELLSTPHPNTRKQAQSIVGSLNQLAAWCPNLKSQMPKLRKLTGNGIFRWSDEHDEELDRVKEAVRKHIKLTPFDCSKPVHLHVDASQEGLGYLLSHPLEPDKEDSYRLQRQLVTLGSTGLTNTQFRYSTVELECLALVHAVSKLDYFLRHSNLIKVYTDSQKPLCILEYVTY